ncbi:MAG: VTT domain-containing protein [Clostridium sp.]|nr:VTT domain-containing protein [Clostridium sp.]
MINRVKNYRKNMKCFMIYLLSVAALFVSGFYLIKFVSLVNEYGFQNMLSMYAEKEKLIYFLVCFLQPIILPLPEPVTIMGGSSLLGSQIGATIGFIGTFLGIISMFFASKYVGKAIVSKLVDEKKLEKFNKFIQKNEMLVILMLFILPILPDEVICVGSGIAGINTYKFIILFFRLNKV